MAGTFIQLSANIFYRLANCQSRIMGKFKLVLKKHIFIHKFNKAAYNEIITDIHDLTSKRHTVLL
jgi:hypothetical protein